MATVDELAPTPAWHADFLELRPRLEGYARVVFAAWRCAARREDAVQECVALAWFWYAGLRGRGKDARQFPVAFVFTVARAVRSGRRLCGRERSRDVLSPLAQQRRGLRVEPLGAGRRSHDVLYGLVQGQEELDAYEARLHDNAQSSPADAAAFRIDFPEFLAGLSQRDRDLAMFLSLGHRTTRAAARFGLTPGRVSQLRRQWCEAWQLLQGELPVKAQPAGLVRPGQS